MRLSKTQMAIVDALQNGSHIRVAAGHPYLVRKDKDGRFKSEHLHGKVFTSLKQAGIIATEDGTIYNLV